LGVVEGRGNRANSAAKQKGCVAGWEGEGVDKTRKTRILRK